MSTSGSDDSQTPSIDRKATVQRLKKLEDSVVLLHRCFQSDSPLLGSLKVVDGSSASPGDATREEAACFHACLAELEQKLCSRMGMLEAKVWNRCLALEESLALGSAGVVRGRDGSTACSADAACEEVANHAGRVGSLEQCFRQVDAAAVDNDASSAWRADSEETVVLGRICEWIEKLDSDVREAVTRLTEWVTKLDSDVNGLQRLCSQAQQGAEEVSQLAGRMSELNETVVDLKTSCRGCYSLEDDPVVVGLLKQVADLDDRVKRIPAGFNGVDAVLQFTEEMSRLEVDIRSYRVLCDGASKATQDANMALQRDVVKLQEGREMMQQHLDVLQLQMDALQIQFEKETSALASSFQRAVEDKSSVQRLDQVWDGLSAERQEREASFKALSESLTGRLHRLVEKVDGTCAELKEAYDVGNMSLSTSQSMAALHSSPSLVKRARSSTAGDPPASEQSFLGVTTVVAVMGESAEAEAAGNSVSRAVSAPPRRASYPGGATPVAAMPVLLGGLQAQHGRPSGESAVKDKHLCPECSQARRSGSPPAKAVPQSPQLAARPPLARPPCGASSLSKTRTDSNPVPLQFAPKLAVVVEGQPRVQGPVRLSSTPSSPAIGCRSVVVPGTYSPGIAKRSPSIAVIPPA